MFAYPYVKTMRAETDIRYIRDRYATRVRIGPITHTPYWRSSMCMTPEERLSRELAIMETCIEALRQSDIDPVLRDGIWHQWQRTRGQITIVLDVLTDHTR